MDTDQLLNFESECYNKGFNEGLNKGRDQGHTEGRELGIQTGFLRYLPFGVLQARVEDWRRTDNSESLKALSALVASPNLTNDPEVVEKLDWRLRQGKNKCRMVASAKNSPPLDVHDQKIVFHRDPEGTAAIEDMY